MRIQFSQAVMAVAISSALCLGSAWGQAPQQPQPQAQGQAAQPAKPATPQWTDRAEYELVINGIDKEQDPKKKLQLLDQWKEKYPNTQLKIERLARYLDVYRALQDPMKMWDTAKEIMALSDNPNLQARLNSLYWLNLLVPSASVTAPDKNEVGEKAAHQLLTLADEYFTAANKPPNVAEPEWQKTKTQMQSLAHRTLGFIAFYKTPKDLETAEKEYTEAAKLNPADADAFYMLGTTIIAEKKPERQSEALYYIARAAAYDGPGQLDPARRQQLNSYIEKAFTTYHGKDPQGLQQLLQQAKANPFPPQGFHIPSADEVQAQHEKQLEASNPSLAFWLKLKAALQAPDGQQYFDTGMKGALIPPESQPAFRGTVIGAEGTARAVKSVTLGISDPRTSEVRLTFETPMAGRPEAGAVIEFRGIAESFAKEPFLVTMATEKKYVSGWPTPEPVRKAPVRKAPRRKK